jgi:hypothetical protein
MKILPPACLALIGALAVSSAAGQSAPAKPVARSCFWIRNVNNFAAVDNENLYVRVGVSQVFRLKLFGNCLNLSWVHHLGLTSRSMSNICEGANQNLDVVYRDRGVGRQRCPVTGVQKLTPEEVAALPKDARP